MLAERVRVRDNPGLARERHIVAVPRQSIEVGAEVTREPFEAIERACRLERLRVKSQCDGRRIATRAAARIFLGVLRMRRGIGAEKKFRAAARRGCEQRFAMPLAL